MARRREQRSAVPETPRTPPACRRLHVSVRYRCSGCGNLTRFDVVASQRTRSLHHFSVAGDLTVEDEAGARARVEQITCVWCGATGDAIAEIAADTPADN